jgi:hypothetical protein
MIEPTAASTAARIAIASLTLQLGGTPNEADAVYEKVRRMDFQFFHLPSKAIRVVAQALVDIRAEV